MWADAQAAAAAAAGGAPGGMHGLGGDGGPPVLAAGLGVVFMVGRLIYRQAYMRDPSTRGTGMVIGFLANVGLMALSLWGAIGML